MTTFVCEAYSRNIASKLRTVSGPPMSILRRSTMIYAVVIFFSLFAGCGFFPESTFHLASDARLPKWFVLPSGLTRDQVSVDIEYYIGLTGRTATMTLRGPTKQVLQRLSGAVKGRAPTQLKSQPAGFSPGYPTFEIITANGVTDVVEHRRLEPIFYCVDDAEILAELGVKN